MRAGCGQKLGGIRKWLHSDTLRHAGGDLISLITSHHIIKVIVSFYDVLILPRFVCLFVRLSVCQQDYSTVIDDF